jgi:Holliday junction resolvase
VKESELWQKLKRGFGDGVHLTRIENTAGTGVSDVLAVSAGKYIMIELKVAHAHWIEFRPAQIAWIAQHVTCGGDVRVVAVDDDMIYYCGGGQTWWRTFIAALKKHDLRFKLTGEHALFYIASTWSDLKKGLFG